MDHIYDWKAKLVGEILGNQMNRIISYLFIVLVSLGLPAHGQTNAVSLLSEAAKLLNARDIQRAYDLLSSCPQEELGTNGIDLKPILASLKKLADDRKAQDLLWSTTNGTWFIQAEYDPGFSKAAPWRLRIHFDGAMEQLIGPPPLRTNNAPRLWTNQSLPSLSLTQFAELKRMVELTHLEAMTNNYSSHSQFGIALDSPSDLSSISLAAVVNGATNHASLYGPGWLLSLDDNPHKEDVRRFVRLWITVLEMGRFKPEVIGHYSRLLGQ